jgi:hypothetical protein
MKADKTWLYMTAKTLNKYANESLVDFLSVTARLLHEPLQGLQAIICKKLPPA